VFKKQDAIAMSTLKMIQKSSYHKNNSKSSKKSSLLYLCGKEININELYKSPKILALLQMITKMKPDEKGVIYSQFTQFLDIIESQLESAGYTTCRIDGTMPNSSRIKSMHCFNLNGIKSPRFILCALKAAGTGINLIRGNWCFIMDP